MELEEAEAVGEVLPQQQELPESEAEMEEELIERFLLEIDEMDGREEVEQEAGGGEKEEKVL